MLLFRWQVGCGCDGLLVWRVFRKRFGQVAEEQANSSKKLFTGPVLVPAIGQVSAHDQGNLLLAQLLDGNLKGIRLALNID